MIGRHITWQQARENALQICLDAEAARAQYAEEEAHRIEQWGDGMSEGLTNVVDDIVHERWRQDIQWGGPEHDDQHDPADWLMFIQYQMSKGYSARENLDTADYRERLVKIAALAAAGIESLDRKAAS